MTNVTIHGKLGKIFGENHKFQIKRMSEVVNAINANSHGFRKKILSDFKSGDHYYFIDPKRPDKKYKRPEEFLNSKPPEELHIVPSVDGSATVVVGALLSYGGAQLAIGAVGAKLFFAKVLFNVGIALILQGVQQLLFPVEPAEQGLSANIESKIDTASYIFSSLKNNAVQGFPIPLLYGELRVGSNIISTSVTSQDLGTSTS